MVSVLLVLCAAALLQVCPTTNGATVSYVTWQIDIGIFSNYLSTAQRDSIVQQILSLWKSTFDASLQLSNEKIQVVNEQNLGQQFGNYKQITIRISGRGPAGFNVGSLVEQFKTALEGANISGLKTSLTSGDAGVKTTIYSFTIQIQATFSYTTNAQRDSLLQQILALFQSTYASHGLSNLKIAVDSEASAGLPGFKILTFHITGDSSDQIDSNSISTEFITTIQGANIPGISFETTSTDAPLPDASTEVSGNGGDSTNGGGDVTTITGNPFTIRGTVTITFTSTTQLNQILQQILSLWIKTYGSQYGVDSGKVKITVASKVPNGSGGYTVTFTITGTSTSTIDVTSNINDFLTIIATAHINGVVTGSISGRLQWTITIDGLFSYGSPSERDTLMQTILSLWMSTFGLPNKFTDEKAGVILETDVSGRGPRTHHVTFQITGITGADIDIQAMINSFIAILQGAHISGIEQIEGSSAIGQITNGNVAGPTSFTITGHVVVKYNVKSELDRILQAILKLWIQKYGSRYGATNVKIVVSTSRPTGQGTYDVTYTITGFSTMTISVNVISSEFQKIVSSSKITGIVISGGGSTTEGGSGSGSGEGGSEITVSGNGGGSGGNNKFTFTGKITVTVTTDTELRALLQSILNLWIQKYGSIYGIGTISIKITSKVPSGSGGWIITYVITGTSSKVVTTSKIQGEWTITITTSHIHGIFEEGETTTPSGGEDTTPAAGGEETTPSAGGEETTPAAGGEETTPAAGGEETTPAAGGEETTPAAGGEETTPAAGGEETTPAAGGDETTPAAGGEETTPAAGGDETTPAAGGEETTPAAGGEETTPAAGGEETTPAAGGETTPGTEEGSPTPNTSNEEGGSTPSTEGEIVIEGNGGGEGGTNTFDITGKITVTVTTTTDLRALLQAILNLWIQKYGSVYGIGNITIKITSKVPNPTGSGFIITYVITGSSSTVVTIDTIKGEWNGIIDNSGINGVVIGTGTIITEGGEGGEGGEGEITVSGNGGGSGGDNNFDLTGKITVTVTTTTDLRALLQAILNLWIEKYGSIYGIGNISIKITSKVPNPTGSGFIITYVITGSSSTVVTIDTIKGEWNGIIDNSGINGIVIGTGTIITGEGNGGSGEGGESEISVSGNGGGTGGDNSFTFTSTVTVTVISNSDLTTLINAILDLWIKHYGATYGIGAVTIKITSKQPTGSGGFVITYTITGTSSTVVPTDTIQGEWTTFINGAGITGIVVEGGDNASTEGSGGNSFTVTSTVKVTFKTETELNTIMQNILKLWIERYGTMYGAINVKINIVSRVPSGSFFTITFTITGTSTTSFDVDANAAEFAGVIISAHITGVVSDEGGEASTEVSTEVTAAPDNGEGGNFGESENDKINKDIPPGDFDVELSVYLSYDSAAIRDNFLQRLLVNWRNALHEYIVTSLNIAFVREQLNVGKLPADQGGKAVNKVWYRLSGGTQNGFNVGAVHRVFERAVIDSHLGGVEFTLPADQVTAGGETSAEASASIDNTGAESSGSESTGEDQPAAPKKCLFGCVLDKLTGR